MHLDLSYTELQDNMLRKIINAIKESNSLMAVHLCGNPGISPSLIDYC